MALQQEYSIQISKLVNCFEYLTTIIFILGSWDYFWLYSLWSFCVSLSIFVQYR